ncbi:MAG TPA: DnaJ domain-containing protein [Casimicrobiaceae bacterium]
MAWMLLSHGHQALGPTEPNVFEEHAVLYTYYDYLDLPPGASTARIEAAYRTIRQRLDEHAADETLVRLIHEAHALLSDPDQRHVYDEELERTAAEADAELKALLDEEAKKPQPRRVQDVPTPLVAAIRAWAA